MKNAFKEALFDPATFCVSWELIPGRGAREAGQANVLASATQAAADRNIHAITLTDMPGGHPALTAEALGSEIRALGIEPLIHFTCKDRNRNQIESQLYAMEHANIHNLLVMTGDYPDSGYAGRPKPVFDLDPVHVLQLISELNAGLPIPAGKGTAVLQPCDFFSGCAVSPFKALPGELVMQYLKLEKKIAAGAQFVITQLGYDARKFHEVLQVVRQINPAIPVIGNIYILPYGAGKMMRENRLPGCVVTDQLLAQLDQERTAPDKGVQARLQRAAKMYAWLKGFGFDGVHIGGNNLRYEQVAAIIRQGEEFYSHWQDFLPEFDLPQPQGFYVFQRDPSNGLNSDTLNEHPRPVPRAGERISYALMRLFHCVFFTPQKKLYPLMRFIYRHKNPRHYPLEHLIKILANHCQDCGDCALFDTAYLCPMSQCPKNQRNGPCGGSCLGWCEVFPLEQPCVWVRAYARLGSHEQAPFPDQRLLPPVNWALSHTSAWHNYFNGRDHTASAQDKTFKNTK
ncbi:MAG: methylenetetrahydrofolate reductase C-terminal domain-containing protein [Peptococcaceae bacterium]|nr:methylenetetrahydrofolate reductase C-terminal domain-containing protein [Peptococcaceae bacterium]